MRLGERVAFWHQGEIHIGTVTTVDPFSGALMARCPTIDHESFMIHPEDLILEEDEDDDG